MNKKTAFSLIEILMAMVFISLAFLPIYNLFRYGKQGTVNNLNEVTATNYASDMINFVRDLNVSQINTVIGGKDEKEYKTDVAIASAFKKINKVVPPKVEKPYERSMTLKYFKGKNKKGLLGIVGWLSDLINKRRSVPNYLVKVTVSFPGQVGKKIDNVTLYSIVMD